MLTEKEAPDTTVQIMSAADDTYVEKAPSRAIWQIWPDGTARPVTPVAEPAEAPSDGADWARLTGPDGSHYLIAPETDLEEPAAYEASSGVIATLSHELRTPLNGILGTASLLAETRLSASQRDYVETLQSSCHQLLDMLNTALDFARLDSEPARIEAAPFSPAEVARDVCELLAPRAHARGLDLAARVAPGTPTSFLGDGSRLRQILFNLVGNAVKFTEAGGILIDMSGHDGCLMVSVIDTGPGISPDARHQLFRPFNQLRPDITAREGGIGLGLAIVSHLVDAMSGVITVGGTVGFGARFDIDLPLPAAGADDVPGRPDAAQSKTIGLCGLAAPTLLSLEATCRTAGHAVRVLDPAEPLPCGIDLVLADAALAPKQLKRLANDAPLISVLRPQDRGVISRLRRDGAAGYLVRPVRPASVLTRIAAVLDGSWREDVGDPAVGRGRGVLVVDDNAINAMIARRALEKAGFLVTVANTGAEALEAVEAQEFSLVFMDLRMPIMSGFEAMQAMRARGHDVPVIAVSAEVDPEIERRALSAGANAVASKPIDAETLRVLADEWALACEADV